MTLGSVFQGAGTPGGLQGCGEVCVPCSRGSVAGMHPAGGTSANIQPSPPTRGTFRARDS